MHCLFQGGYIKHEKTGLCLDLDVEGPIMRTCAAGVITQIWQFNTYVEESSALSKARQQQLRDEVSAYSITDE